MLPEPPAPRVTSLWALPAPPPAPASLQPLGLDYPPVRPASFQPCAPHLLLQWVILHWVKGPPRGKCTLSEGPQGLPLELEPRRRQMGNSYSGRLGRGGLPQSPKHPGGAGALGSHSQTLVCRQRALTPAPGSRPGWGHRCPGAGP